MRKVILQLTGIEYSGESIGDDIRIEIEALGSLLSLNEQLSNMESITFDKEIGKAFIDQSALDVSVMIRIIERDLVFSDVGSKKTLTVKEKTYKTIDYQEYPWQKGLYDIELPDVPHKGGQNYLNASSKAFVWFRVGHAGERYIHIGRRTLGCITLTEHDRWNSLYDLLIKARKGDSISVGTLEVID